MPHTDAGWVMSHAAYGEYLDSVILSLLDERTEPLEFARSIDIGQRESLVLQLLAERPENKEIPKYDEAGITYSPMLIKEAIAKTQKYRNELIEDTKKQLRSLQP